MWWAYSRLRLRLGQRLGHFSTIPFISGSVFSPLDLAIASSSTSPIVFASRLRSFALPAISRGSVFSYLGASERDRRSLPRPLGELQFLDFLVGVSDAGFHRAVLVWVAAMTGKAKPKKHTAKEIAAKVDAATTNRGGGKAGLEDRSGAEKGGHAKLACPVCRVTAPDIKSMQIHHEARHPKQPFEEDKLINMHAGGASEKTPNPEKTCPEKSNLDKGRPGVRGSFKK